MLLSRKLFATALASWVFVPSACLCEGAVKIIDDGLHLSSPYLDARVSLQQPGFSLLVVDGLGQGKIGPNALRAPAKSEVAYQVTRGEADGRIWVEYRRQGTAPDAAPGWRFEIGDRDIWFISQWSETEQPTPLLLNFDPERGHVTLLGLMNDGRCGSPAGGSAASPIRAPCASLRSARRGRRWATTPSRAIPTKRTSSR